MLVALQLLAVIAALGILVALALLRQICRNGVATIC